MPAIGDKDATTRMLMMRGFRHFRSGPSRETSNAMQNKAEPSKELGFLRKLLEQSFSRNIHLGFHMHTVCD